MPIGNDIRAAGAVLLATDPATTANDLAEQLNTHLNTFLPARFRAMRAHALKDEPRVPSSSA